MRTLFSSPAPLCSPSEQTFLKQINTFKSVGHKCKLTSLEIWRITEAASRTSKQVFIVQMRSQSVVLVDNLILTFNFSLTPPYIHPTTRAVCNQTFQSPVSGSKQGTFSAPQFTNEHNLTEHSHSCIYLFIAQPNEQVRISK